MQAAAQGWQRRRGLKERKQRRDAGAWRGGYRAGSTESRSIGDRDLAKGNATKDLALSRTTASGQAGNERARQGTQRPMACRWRGDGLGTRALGLR